MLQDINSENLALSLNLDKKPFTPRWFTRGNYRFQQNCCQQRWRNCTQLKGIGKKRYGNL